MAYLITADDVQTVNLAPANVVEEVLQNVATIISTVKYSIPLDREFGIDGAVVDLPMIEARAKMTNEIFQAIKRYEPRAVIQGINYKGTLEGKLMPTVEVTINGAE